MEKTKIDVKQMKADLNETADKIRKCKRFLRNRENQTKWDEMNEHRWELGKLKWVATDLCVTRAHMRGKVHIRDMPLEEIEAIYERVVLDYEIDDEDLRETG